MCFAKPQQPNIVYQGPSQEDIAKNQASLDQYKSQMQQQQDAFKAQLQQQIDAANSETAAIKTKYDAEAAAASAAAAAQQAGSYAMTATQTDPVNAQTTAAVTQKKKPANALKITTAGTATAAGAGLNIGV
jgi:outer membrane translocation and assembly module TamA